ncbi:MAG TPA: ankyrin repeat domain-containing protein [Longimicrobiales bacterium]
MPASSERSLPSDASLEQQRKQAKELLRALRRGDAAAHERLRRWLPDKRRLTLADAQLVLAREYGFESWVALKQHIEGVVGDRLTPDIESELRRALAARDAKAIRSLLTRHPAARSSIDAPLFPFDSTALGHAAGAGDLALVEVLLEFGADPNRRSSWWAGGFHPLHSATGAVAERLIEAGAVPDACAAANLDRPDLLRALLDEDPARVHERGGDGQTPLHFARSRAVVDLLLERGADIDARDVDHRATPAQWMLQRRRGAGRYELARYLVERGAGVDIFLAAALGLTDEVHAMLQRDRSLLDLRTGQGEYGERPPSSFHIYFWTIGPNLSPLDVAAQFDQIGAVSVLADHASVTQRFLAACAAARTGEAKQLLARSPELLAQLTPQDRRALPDAAWSAHAAAVELMLELGFDPRTPGWEGGTALHCAAWQGSVACVEALLRHPAAPHLVDARDPKYGTTALGWCCHGAQHCGDPRADHARVARLLLGAGARPPDGWEEAPESVRAAIAAYLQ